MRYSAEHKRRTRERIVHEARRLFRRKGYDGTSLDALMAAAGLTRGGFYKHFRSKAELFAEAMAREPDFVTRMKGRGGDTRSELVEEALALVDGYLDPANRERVGPGCEMASLSVDVARASKRARRNHTANVRELVAEFERGLARRRGQGSPDPRALATIGLCIGGLTIARALEDEGLAAALLEACRDLAHDQLTGA